jgi:Zn finger protein HypA/HybF involved in hydrogenase expression
MLFHPRLISLVAQIPASKTVRIALGELFPLSEEELRVQWAELVKGTPLSESTLYIRMIPAEQQCMVCFEKYHPADQETACPNCMSAGAKILAGEEFYVETNRE